MNLCQKCLLVATLSTADFSDISSLIVHKIFSNALAIMKPVTNKIPTKTGTEVM